MSTPVRRMTHYSGLATGQGPSTFSTSPLWSPYGPYSMNRQQFEGKFGALDFHGYHGENGDTKPTGKPDMMGMVKEYFDHKTYGVPTWMLVTGAFLAYRSGMLNSILPMPIRANRWDAMSDAPVASNMAKMRWAKASGDDGAVNTLNKFFAKLSGMSLKDWTARKSLKAYGPYRSSSSKRRTAKPEGFVAAIVDAITPDMEPSTKKSKKKSTKRKPALSSRGRKIVSVTKKTEKKRLTKSKRSEIALKRRAMKLGQKYGLKEGWKIAKSELAYADARGNPKRRRKNGTKKGQTRKTARRAYMRNRR